MMKRIRMKEEWNGGGQGFPLRGRGYGYHNTEGEREWEGTRSRKMVYGLGCSTKSRLGLLLNI